MTQDARLVEYQVLQNFRLEWSMVAHRWGYILVPLCGTILGITWTFSRENLFVGILVTIGLVFIWRYMHHYYDDVIKKLYLRLVEIEEELDMMFTRRYLTEQMQKSKLFNENFKKGQLVTGDFISRYQEWNIFGSRGLGRWDLVSGITILLLCLWLILIHLQKNSLFVLALWIPTVYALYFFCKDRQD